MTMTDGDGDRNENNDLGHPVLYHIANERFTFAKYVPVSEHYCSYKYFSILSAFLFRFILRLSLINVDKKNLYKFYQSTNLRNSLKYPHSASFFYSNLLGTHGARRAGPIPAPHRVTAFSTRRGATHSAACPIRAFTCVRLWRRRLWRRWWGISFSAPLAGRRAHAPAGRAYTRYSR